MSLEELQSKFNRYCQSMNQETLPCLNLCLSLSHVQLFATLWTAAHQPPLSMGFSGKKYWSGLPLSPPGDLPDPEIQLLSPASSPSQVNSLLLSCQGSPETMRDTNKK